MSVKMFLFILILRSFYRLKYVFSMFSYKKKSKDELIIVKDNLCL